MYKSPEELLEAVFERADRLRVNVVRNSVSGPILETVKNAHGVDLVYINRGYGVEQIRQGIEELVKLATATV